MTQEYPRTLKQIPVADIRVEERLRKVDEQGAGTDESYEEGEINPISIDEDLVLIGRPQTGSSQEPGVGDHRGKGL